MTPLLLAIKYKVHDIARLIITEVKADPDARDKNENTALHIAAQNEDLHGILLLMLHKSNINKKN